MSDSPIVIYTDGACSGNPGPGGWGVVLRHGEREKHMFGGEPATTNNRMELTAAIRALECLRSGRPAHLYTDSQYVKQGIQSWIAAWKRRGWRKADGKPVLNQDLWSRLDELDSALSVTWKWVRGHSGDPGNELADELARAGIERARRGETAAEEREIRSRG